ncbi:MAG: MGDG synthase family glycosyltransferase [Culicoidibacterales bacterium]
MKKIMVVSAPYGNGHHQAAMTLVNQFVAQGHIVEHFDIIADEYPKIAKITTDIYKLSFKPSLHKVYKFSYDAVEKMVESKLYSQLSSVLGRSKAYERIMEFQPDAIVSTFPVPAISAMKQQGKISQPLFEVITDYTAHRTWFHPAIDHYFVADAIVQEIGQLKAEIGHDKFTITGIPVREMFEDSTPLASTVYAEYELQAEQPILLFIAGAAGVVTNVEATLRELLVHETLQIVFIAGKNEKLQQQVADLATEYEQRLVVLGYVEEIADLYRIADLVLTKPGGITVSELAMTQTPAIFIDPMPGQELDNALLFSARQAAIIISQITELAPTAMHLLANPEELKTMRQGYERLRHPQAAQLIVEKVTHDGN